MQNDHARDGYDEQNLVNMLKGQGFEVIDKKDILGWEEALAWEIDEICRRCFGKVVKIAIFPIMSMLMSLDLKLKNRWGNAILILAVKRI